MRRIRDCLIAQAAPERNSILLIVSLSFLAGCLAALRLTGGLWLWMLAGLCLPLGWLLRRLGVGAGTALALCFFALGVLRFQSAYFTPQPDPGTYEIAGYVYGGTTLRTDQRVSFILGDMALDGAPVPGTAYCTLHYDDAPPVLFDGAQVRFEGRVYLPDGKSGEPHMDLALWMRQSGQSFGIAAYQGIAVLNAEADAPVKDAAYRVRQAFTRALERVMGEEARVAVALLLGEREGLSQQERDAFETLGVAHVMSVSGLHVGLLGGLLLFLLRCLRVRRARRLPALAVFLLGYCALTGFSAASVRAAVMLMLTLLAQLTVRRPDRLTTLAAAMLAVLALDPLQAWSAGFVLSFSAMLGITLLLPPLRRLFAHLFPHAQRNRRLRYALIRFGRGALSLLAVSLAAQAGVLLPTAAYFHQLPLYGVVINLLIVPLAGTLLTPLCAITLLFSPVPLVGQALGWAASLLARLLLGLVELLSTLPGASARVASPPVLAGPALALITAMLSGRAPGSLRRRALASALVLAVAVGGMYISRPADVRYIQLAVGQADCALLLDGEQTILIDAGSDGEAALDYLLAEGRDVDALFITHLHLDHIGGVADLLDAGVPIGQVYLPLNAARQQADPDALRLLDRLAAAGVPVMELARGDEMRYNTTSISVLWPVGEHIRSGQDPNELPLVLSIGFGPYTLLSASDLSGAYERYAAAPADVLKVAHHGSASSTGEAFLEQVGARVALVSCSSGSRYLPGEETLERLKQSGAQVLRTDACGDITLTLRGGQLCITPYKARWAP